MHASAVVALLPVLPRSLGVGESGGVEWVVIAYFLALSISLLTFGQLGDSWGHRRIYLAGMCVFVASSALCGVARQLPALIAFRAGQGLGAAMVSATATAILGRTLAPDRRGGAVGWQSAMTYFGLILGPAVGGFLAGRSAWRYVFLLNVCVGLPALWAAQRFIPRDDESAGPRRPLDLRGSALWSCALVAALLVLNRGQTWGWASGRVLALSGLAALLLSGFVYVEARADNPLLGPRLMRNFGLSAAALSEMLYYCCTYAAGFLLPLFLIRVMGMEPFRAGLLLAVPAVARMLAAPVSGVIADRAGARRPTTAGVALLAVAFISLAQVTADISLNRLSLSLILLGCATGVFVPGNSTALLASAPHGLKGSAVAVLGTARNVGMALGTMCAASIYAAAPGDGAGARLSAIRLGFAACGGLAALMLLIPLAEWGRGGAAVCGEGASAGA
jgi:EmrB/QacA subfamily drug resistance transporter